MKASHVAMVVFSYYPLDVRVRRAAEALADAGMRIDVIALRGNGEPRKDQINRVKVYRINIKRQRTTKLRYLWEYGNFIFSSFIKLSFLHILRQYKVVHVHTLPDILALSAAFTKITGAKVILDMHDLMPELFRRKFGINENHKIIRAIKLLEKVSIKIANHVITASPYFRENLINRSLPPEKCTTILNLPDPKYFNTDVKQSPCNQNKFRIIYPGTLGEIHGVDIVINAIEKIVKLTDIPVELHIYGAGAESERNKLIELTRKLNLENFIRFYSKIPAEKLGAIYTSMDVGVVPKRNGVHAMDAMSTKLFEYAAVGLPAIVSRTKSDSLYFDDPMVLFFEPENEKELADCIIKLYHDPHLRWQLSINSKLLYKKINWSSEKNKLLSVYERLISD